MTAPTLADDEEGTAAAAMGLSSYPFFVVVRPDGTVAERTAGDIGADEFERRQIPAYSGLHPPAEVTARYTKCRSTATEWADS